MLYGCCVNMLPGAGVLAGAGYAGKLAEIGYDYIELPLNRLTKLSGPELRRAAELVRESGLPCRSCNDFMPSSYSITGDDLTPRREIEGYLHRAFQIIGPEGLDAQYAVFGSPWSRRCPENFPMETALRQISAFLLRVGDIAAGHGITVAVEHNNRSETNTLNHLSDVIALVNSLSHPNVKVLCDYYHFRYEGDSVGALTHGRGLIVHTHIAKLEGRRYFTDTEGESPMVQTYARALHEIGYNGGISIEAIVPDQDEWEEAARRNLRQLHQVFDQSGFAR